MKIVTERDLSVLASMLGSDTGQGVLKHQSRHLD